MFLRSEKWNEFNLTWNKTKLYLGIMETDSEKPVGIE